MSEHGTQSIDRAIELVARVVGAGRPMTYSELCDATGLARSTTSRLLAALDRGHLLQRDPEVGWEPGALFEQYAATTTPQERLARIARPVMNTLSELTDETINLGVPFGRSVVQIAQVNSNYFLGSRDWVGVDLPAHTSALGKVLYAHGLIPCSPGPLDTLTEHTLTTGVALADQFETIRERGYASTVDELELGLTGIAAPVEVDGTVVAALGISGPTSRLVDDIDATGRVVAAQAAALSTRLGPTRNEGAA